MQPKRSLPRHRSCVFVFVCGCFILTEWVIGSIQLRMRKSCAVIVLLLAIVGQAWASVCNCSELRPVHSCCKRKVEKNSYASSKGCCDSENCSVQRSSPSATTLTLSTGVVGHIDAATSPSVPFSASKLFVKEPVRVHIATGRYKPHARPPDLYVRHHAFRI